MTATPFRVLALKQNQIQQVCAAWDSIDFEPVYQRQADIWEESKRQLFVDSLINGYDIPKLYFHELDWTEKRPRRRYAIVDGKQRLLAIRGFVDGDFALSDDFEYLERPSAHAAGMTYQQLSKRFPDIKLKLDEAELPIVVVQTEDLELIDEMFTRLNEAVPLNAPEKRNALGGPLPKRIRDLTRVPFFRSKLAFQNSRYRHLDLATKFLYIEYRDGLTDLKKRDLDDFVKTFRSRNWVRKTDELYKRTSLVLDLMADVFVASDPLLKSIGMIVLYYQLLRDAWQNDWLTEVQRARLVEFEDQRELNRTRVREAQELALTGKRLPPDVAINPALVAFERFVQSPNDVTALTKRYETLKRFVRAARLS